MRFFYDPQDPRTYHFAWDQDTKTIILLVHRECEKLIPEIPRDSNHAKFLAKEFGFKTSAESFCGSIAGDFYGFNRAIEKVGVVGDYLKFKIPLPRIKKPSDKACDRCKGSGKDPFSDPEEDRPCYTCSGTGKGFDYDWDAACSITLSLNIFLNYADSRQTSAKEWQYMLLAIGAKGGQHGSSLGGHFGSDVADYLCTAEKPVQDQVFKSCIEAMRAAHEHMYQFKKYDNDRIRADDYSGAFGFTVPGDACNVATIYREHKVGSSRGIEITCHNVDNPLQSLTLLTGLVCFVDKVSQILGKK